MLPSDFANRTRTQRQEFDQYRTQAYEPTQAELQEREEYIQQSMISYLQAKLSPYNIQFTGQETDFAPVYHEYIFGNPPMNERLGKDERMEERYSYQVQYENTLKGLYLFVYTYEG